MSAKSHYEQLHEASGAVVSASFSDGQSELMNKAHAFISDLDKWMIVLAPRKEGVAFQTAVREYQFSLLALSLGAYRSAFSALRLFLELTCATVRWSVNEQELREWLRGDRDLNWTALIDNEAGIFSKKFVRLFSDLFSNEASAYRSSAAAVYRECSQFIHGNAASNSVLPPTLQFDLTTFNLWHEKASVTCLVVTFALSSRYLPDLSDVQKAALEDSLLDLLGHSSSVRQILGAPVEVTND